jgi:hypothetical protein
MLVGPASSPITASMTAAVAIETLPPLGLGRKLPPGSIARYPGCFSHRNTFGANGKSAKPSSLHGGFGLSYAGRLGPSYVGSS